MIIKSGDTVRNNTTHVDYKVHSIRYRGNDAIITMSCLDDTTNTLSEHLYEDIKRYYKKIKDGKPECIDSCDVDTTAFSVPYSKVEKVQPKDKVNHPEHYNQGKYECIDVMEETFGKDAVIQFSICNAFKYLYRCKHKDAMLQDLNKAKWYIEKAIELINKTEPIT